MTPAETHAVETPRTHYLNAAYGLKSWLWTRDHKRIALLYLVSVIVFFALGGLMAVLIRPTATSSSPTSTTACSRCTACS